MPRRKRNLYLDSDLKKFQIESLAKFGGFSHRFIASIAFFKPIGRVTRQEINSVSSYCSRMGIKVSDWRNGRSVMAKNHAEKISRPKKKDKKRLRFAA
jgi:hypothetical protein